MTEQNLLEQQLENVIPEAQEKAIVYDLHERLHEQAQLNKKLLYSRKVYTSLLN